MSIRNFPLIPKIILRKSADQAKGEKNPLCKLAILICRNFEVFDVLLRGATLKGTFFQLPTENLDITSRTLGFLEPSIPRTRQSGAET